MSYLDKINSNIFLDRDGFGPSLAVPHQAFTPRDILQQFVINDVQVQSHVSTDNISVNDPNENMDTLDIQSVFDSLVEFEDDFDAREATTDQIRFVRKRSPKKSKESKVSKETEDTKSSEDDK